MSGADIEDFGRRNLEGRAMEPVAFAKVAPKGAKISCLQESVEPIVKYVELWITGKQNARRDVTVNNLESKPM